MSQSKACPTICLSREFAFVCGTAVGSVFVNQFLAYRVMKARKEFKVEYPRMYHDDPEHQFNCVQRAHQHYLEFQPAFLTVLFVSGIKFPKAAAFFGKVYLAGRIAYAFGYSSGDVNNRKWGIFGFLGGFFPLVGLSIAAVLEMLGFVKIPYGRCVTCC